MIKVHSRVSSMLATTLLLALLGLWPALAWACPSCASSNKSYAAVFPVLIGFIGVPFVIAGSVALAMWRLRRAERAAGARAEVRTILAQLRQE